MKSKKGSTMDAMIKGRHNNDRSIKSREGTKMAAPPNLG
jgi:hypothetical protein